jgi:5-formyltetrahydrofolate cyclo-ligase
MTKEELRKTYAEKRAALTDKERMKLDDLLLIQFQRLSFAGVQTVLSFWPMDDRGEMDTHLYTRYLIAIIPHIQICYPVIDTKSNHMEAFAVEEDTVFEENKYGITEPVNGKQIDPQEIDMVIVPLFAFDERGYRVGYGKGYYDRFLKRCRENVMMAGISYFEPVRRVDDTHEFDVPLNFCITPQNLYEF